MEGLANGMAAGFENSVKPALSLIGTSLAGWTFDAVNNVWSGAKGTYDPLAGTSLEGWTKTGNSWGAAPEAVTAITDAVSLAKNTIPGLSNEMWDQGLVWNPTGPNGELVASYVAPDYAGWAMKQAERAALKEPFVRSERPEVDITPLVQEMQALRHEFKKQNDRALVLARTGATA
jgi:hypothetical protein